MTETKPSLLKSAINGGLLLGLIQIIYSVIMYVFDIMPIGLSKMGIMFVISLLIYFFIIFYSSKSYRNNVLGGYISFGQAFVFGLLLAVFSAILFAIYNYIFNAFIDPDYSEKILSASKSWTESFMESKGVAEAQIEEAMDKIDAKGIVTPLKSVKQALIGGTVFGVIISLITAAIVKKKDEIIS